jgi:hypothetical protein
VLIKFLTDEDNADASLSVSKTKQEQITPVSKRARQVGPISSEEENDIPCLPPGIEEQYGFKINPVRKTSYKTL